MPCRFKPGDYVYIAAAPTPAKIYWADGWHRTKSAKKYLTDSIIGLCVGVVVYDKQNPEITTWLTVLSNKHGLFDIIGANCRVV